MLGFREEGLMLLPSVFCTMLLVAYGFGNTITMQT